MDHSPPISKQEYAVTVTGTTTISKELNFMQISEHLNHSVFWSECSIKLTDIVVSTPPLERSRCSLHLLPWIRNSWFGSPRCNHGSKESEIHRQSTSNLKFWILVWHELHTCRHCTRIRALVGIYRISIPRQCNELQTSMANFIPCPDPNPDLSPVHRVLHVHVGLYSY